jgi:hypothetical protein
VKAHPRPRCCRRELPGNQAVCGWNIRCRALSCPAAVAVPLQVVQRVTGHRRVAVVMEHYFRPGREDFRTAIFRAMPDMLADGGQRSVEDETLASFP